MARTNSSTLPVCFTQSNMVEVCSLALQARLTAPASGTQPVYAAIKQHVALCSQIPFKCSVAGLCCQYKPENLLKELASLLEVNKQRLSENILLPRSCDQLCSLGLEFLSKLSHFVCGCSCPMFGCHFVDGDCLFIFQLFRPE